MDNVVRVDGECLSLGCGDRGGFGLGFVLGVIVGALMAIVMVLKSGKLAHHKANFMMILGEWMTIRDPRELSKIAAKRKSSMALLPYGIPICIGSIGYFLYEGMMM